jgi:hypothetical protein
MGSPKFSALPSACQALRTPTDPPASRPADALAWASGACKPSPSAFWPSRGCTRLHGVRSPFRPPEFPVDASPVLFARSPDSTTGATRGMGGWLDLPPVGTSTPQETPSFAWRTNASLQLLPKAPGSQGMLPYPSPRRTVHESPSLTRCKPRLLALHVAGGVRDDTTDAQACGAPGDRHRPRVGLVLSTLWHCLPSGAPGTSHTSARPRGGA